MRLFQTYVLITSTREGGDNLYVRGFSHLLGSVELIVVGGNRPNSKRKASLSKGIQIKAQVYQKNRLYLSEFLVTARYYEPLTSSGQFEYLNAVLKLIEAFALDPNLAVFERIHQALSHSANFSKQLQLFLYLLNTYHIISPTALKCSNCNKLVTNGRTDLSKSLCTKCLQNSSHSEGLPLGWNLGSYQGLASTINEILRFYGLLGASYNLEAFYN